MSDDNTTSAEIEDLKKLLKQLMSDHRRIDDEIIALRENGTVDMLKIGRMKKIKLILKDKIAIVEDRLMPDIIA